MSRFPRKRKHSEERQRLDSEPDLSLFIQAHEADVIRGPQALVAAKSLEFVQGDSRTNTSIGSALIRWGGESSSQLTRRFAMDEDEDERVDDEEGGIWVDRYDARLLLDRDTFAHTQPSESLGSSTLDDSDGWSDLPSDAEDTFFFAPEEAEDYHRDKRRRAMEKSREERLKARMLEDGEVAEDVWGGSDEEPEDTQKDLMRRTAKHILSSPNPAQLEMRILANHGGDKRFAFLRGRWSRSWQIIKGSLRIELEEEERRRSGLGNLADYGDSSDEEDVNRNPNPEEPVQATAAIDESTPNASQVQESRESEEAEREARRTKAKEWIAKRKETLKP